MLTPADYDDVIVTVAHPSVDIETTLARWIETGPGPRPFVTITAARRRKASRAAGSHSAAIPQQTPRAGGFRDWACFPRLGAASQRRTLTGTRSPRAPWRHDSALGQCPISNPSAFGPAGLLSDLAIGEFGDDVEVADVAGVLL